MKKIMIAFAAVAMAACAQAAAISWSTGNLFDHNGSQMKNLETYTAVVSFYTYDAVNGTYTDVSTSMGGTLSDSTASKTGAYTGATAASGIASGDYYAKVIIQGRSAGDTTDWMLESDYTKVTYDSAALSATSLGFQAAGTLVNSGANYGWTAVPEPTSGLLMLVGLAGLALRRRRA